VAAAVGQVEPMDADNLKLKKLAYNILVLSAQSQLSLFRHVERGDPKGVLDALDSRYERETMSSKLAIQQQLMNVSMKNGADPTVFIAKIDEYR
jgi:hypothetical protein